MQFCNVSASLLCVQVTRLERSPVPTLQVKMSGSMKCEVDVVAAHCYNIQIRADGSRVKHVSRRTVPLLDNADCTTTKVPSLHCSTITSFCYVFHSESSTLTNEAV